MALPAHSPLAATPLHYTHHEWLPAGTLVRVPLGQRSVLGVVWDSGPHTQPPPAGVQPKAILQAWNNVPPLDATWRQLVAFTARYYQRSLGEVALAALPPQLREQPVLSDRQSVWFQALVIDHRHPAGRLAQRQAGTARHQQTRGGCCVFLLGAGSGTHVHDDDCMCR